MACRKKEVHTRRAAEPGGPYSQAVVYKDLIFISSQGAIDPETNQVMQDTIENETRMALDNIRIIMEAAGSSLQNVLQITAYLSDMREYGRFNSVYKDYFTRPKPARACVQTKKLPFGLRVALDAVGHV